MSCLLASALSGCVLLTCSLAAQAAPMQPPCEESPDGANGRALRRVRLDAAYCWDRSDSASPQRAAHVARARVAPRTPRKATALRNSAARREPATFSFTVLAPAERDRAKTRKTLGFVSSAAGLLGLGSAGVLAYAAYTHHHDALSQCADMNKNLCSAQNADLRHRARTYGAAATYAGAIGGTLLAGGLVLVLSASGERDSIRAPRLVLSGDPNKVGLKWKGTF